MKALELNTVFQAVKKNVAIYIATAGEYELVGLDVFDAFFEREVSKLSK